MTQSPKTLRFDPAGVRFPTDGITVAQMRRHEPILFTSRSLENCPARHIEGLAAHYIEHILAERAFRRGAGHPAAALTTTREEFVSALNDAYRQYGLSTGLHQTRQLVRDFETAAAQQAQDLKTLHR